MAFLLRRGERTLSQAVYDTSQALFTVMKEEYLKVIAFNILSLIHVCVSLARTVTFNVTFSLSFTKIKLIKHNKTVFQKHHCNSSTFLVCQQSEVLQEPNMSLLKSQCLTVLIKTIGAAPLSWPIRGVHMLLVWHHHLVLLARKCWCLLWRQQ